MQVSVIVAHPNTQSFNHAIALASVKALERNGHGVNYHDLYQEDFPPSLPWEEFGRNAALPDLVERHCAELSTVRGIVIVHPNWWGQPPAILKGWIDRVMRPGIAYEFNEGDSGEGIPRGLLRARSAIVFNTSNTGASRERDVFGDPLELIWKRCVFGLCGVTDVYRKTFGIVVTSTVRERQEWLALVERTVDESYPGMTADQKLRAAERNASAPEEEGE